MGSYGLICLIEFDWICSINEGSLMEEDLTAKAQRAQSRILFPLPLRGRQRKINVF